MIKTIQLLKESLMTYKKNFTNIIWMTWPIVLLTIIGEYYSSGIEGMGKTKPMDIPFFITAMIISVIAYVAIALFFKPAMSRSLQKNEDNNSFDTKEAFTFARKNIWNYIVLGFWSLVYFIKINWIYVLIIIVAMALSIFLGVSGVVAIGAGQLILASALGLVVFITILVSVIKNVTKFIFPANIFFSKNIKPRASVKESIELGKSHNKNIWKVILSSALFVVSIIIIFGIIAFILGLISNVASIEVVNWLEIIISSLLASVFAAPVSFIILAKGYNKIKGSEITTQ